MARVKGPNGLVLNVDDDVAKGLVDSPSGDFEYVKVEEPKKPAKKAAPKPSDKK